MGEQNKNEIKSTQKRYMCIKTENKNTVSKTKGHISNIYIIYNYVSKDFKTSLRL